MSTINVRRQMTASREAVWGVLADFANIADWNSGITLGLDENGRPIMEPDFDIEPPPGFFESPDQDPPYTWW